ncbi:MAG TPA: cytochrome b/b6 domain-containing protein [Cellvibrio sp.]|nr:cytochrome b/b6 domain-containing protein [Cellvibrio sp.]
MTEPFLESVENTAALDSPINDEKSHLKIWDLPTRVFHWLLVISFVAAYVTNWLGVSYFTYHLWAGYFVVILLVFRILWGVVGTHHAQFVNFVRHPLESVRYALHLTKGKAKSYPGHNPLGALMVLTLLLVLLLQAVTGLFANDEILNIGPLYGYVSHELSLKLTGVHKELFYWIAGAVAIHIAAVLFYVFIKRENLIKAMITGKKPAHGLSEAKTIVSSRIWLALALIVVISAILAWIIVAAPEASLDLGY